MLTDDQLIELGDFCAALELHPQFQVLTAIFDQQNYADFMNTHPHETKKREGLYSERQGYQSFRASMTFYVDAAAQLRDKQLQEMTALSEYDAQPQDID